LSANSVSRSGARVGCSWSQGEQVLFASRGPREDRVPAAPSGVVFREYGEFVTSQPRGHPGQAHVSVEPSAGGVRNHRVGVVRRGRPPIELVDPPSMDLMMKAVFLDPPGE
jgi:hypothetical protein